ncbi:MAG: hypothetical protein KKA67_04495 [Spirochaetes bacterium]|nr:hypothetical protein [Spirochaetota bacterium]MBU1080098.1 hypothetical protein [Spirochaetota bacterium]
MRVHPVTILALTAALAAGCATSKPGAADATSGPSPAANPGSAITESVLPVEGAGRVLVAYFSQGEATRAVAEDLAALLGADIEVIAEKRTRGSGFFAFMGAGADATFGRASPIEAPRYDAAAYDVVYVCTPVWSWSLCPPVRSYLRAFKGTLRRAAFATVSGDTDPDKIVGQMTEEGGVEPFAFVGFAERDFAPGNRQAYAAKIATLVDPLR